jgi:tetratricopeptide (TPR) repeat protein
MARGLFLTLAALCVLAPAEKSGLAETPAALERADELATQGRYKEAISLYDDAARHAPENAVIYYKRGLANLEIKAYDRAAADFTEAIDRDHNLFTARLGRARAHDGLGQTAKAMADVARCLEHNPDDDKALHIRGELLFEAGKYQEAIADLKRATALDPKNIEAWTALAVANYWAGDFEGSTGAFEQAAKRAPTDAKVLCKRAEMHLCKLNFDLAMDDLAKAQELAPHSPEPHAVRARAYFLMMNLDKAANEANEALELDPNCSFALVMRASVNLYTRPPQVEAATRDFQKASQLDPKSALPYLFLAQIWHAKGQPDKARRDLEAAKARLPPTPDGFEKLAAVYEEFGEIDKAIEYQRAAFDAAPEESKAEYASELARLQRLSEFPLSPKE